MAFGVSTGFPALLDGTHDVAFERAANAFRHRDNRGFESQRKKGCSALGL
jgi:hypothetical protein